MTATAPTPEAVPVTHAYSHHKHGDRPVAVCTSSDVHRRLDDLLAAVMDSADTTRSVIYPTGRPDLPRGLPDHELATVATAEAINAGPRHSGAGHTIGPVPAKTAAPPTHHRQRTTGDARAPPHGRTTGSSPTTPRFSETLWRNIDMCGINHNLFPRPGYLIDITCESIAAKVLFTRMLSHHTEIGLTPEQITRLIDLNAEYQAELIAIRVQFAQVTEQLEHKRGRLDTQTLIDRKDLLDRHAELFHAEEILFFTYGARGHELLGDEQIATIDQIYHAEKDARLAELLPSLNNAVAPRFQLTAVTA
ncbi:hypothetical protein KIF24_16835 [Micromonospora sp. Llam7]|uniref:hypothetical protein n=1 Tax=Micromonospora tarapacensis TaxID=2835305 RepID=UPI001C82D296|nr:hypothetical protein [Micromonospora tarapacensis]MBX7267530.1 hypothetical protein [Micromonospora tarapacensis]